MSDTPKSMPPPANTMEKLAGDLLAVAARRIIDTIACTPSFEPMRQLKDALEVYEQARLGNILNDPPPLPTCADCKHRDRCDGIPEEDRDCYEPNTLRSRPR